MLKETSDVNYIRADRICDEFKLCWRLHYQGNINARGWRTTKIVGKIRLRNAHMTFSILRQEIAPTMQQHFDGHRSQFDTQNPKKTIFQ